MRVGTLDEPARCPPDVHVFTGSKQPWGTLTETAPVSEEYYDEKGVWSTENLKRWEVFSAASREEKAQEEGEPVRG